MKKTVTVEVPYYSIYIYKQFERALEKDRKSLIQQNRKKKNENDKKVRLIFTQNQGNPPLHQWLRESQKYLTRNERARELGKNVQIAYRQPRNIKQMVIMSSNEGRGHDNMENDAGCTKCGRCHACNTIKEGKLFTSTNTNKNYVIRQKVDCNSSFIVYLGTCRKCRGQYVGKSTQQFKRRHSGHKSEIKREHG